MELVYLWVENYKNIHHQGFNFSPRFHCEYNEEDNELTIDKNDDYISDFFGKNINVTAIVGKNGSGKSSVLNAIVNCIENEPTMKEKYLLVLQDDRKKFSYFSNFDIGTSLKKCEDINSKLQLIIYLDREDNDNLPIDMGATELSRKEKYPWVNYNEIDISKETIINLLAVEIGKNDSSFKLSTFMYLPNKISIEIKTPKKLISENIRFILEDNQKIEDYFMSLSDIEHQLLIIEYLRKHGIKKNILNKIKKKKELPYPNNLKEIVKLIHNKKECNIDKLTEKEKNLYLRRDGYFYLLNFDLIDKKNRRYNTLSHGEKMIFGQLLNLYFYSLKNQNVIFLFDEPEVALHPDWQKRYMNEVLILLQKMKGKNYFIFTSHSPFLLSDIPKQNIIFLDTYKKEDKELKSGKQKIENCKVLSHDEVLSKKQTFGANIHTLLSDSFFMEDGLMGEFAKRKINEIKKLYQLIQDENIQKKLENQKTKELAQKAFNRRKKRLWQIQKIIGEPFLQRVIKNYLDDLELLFSDDETLIAKELAEIEERKQYLEALQKRKG